MNEIQEIVEALKSYSPYIFLDYDGTLVPIIMNPEESYADPDLLSIIESIRRRYRTFIVTGRSLEEIRKFLPVDLDLICYHGACSVIGGKESRIENFSLYADACSTIYEETSGWPAQFPGLRIYRKKLAVLYHTGLMEQKLKPDLKARLDCMAAKYGMEIYTGKMIYEFRVPGVNKGNAIKNIRGNHPALIIGDDETDESSFEANDDPYAITVKVGSGNTKAKYRIENYISVRDLLRNIA